MSGSGVRVLIALVFDVAIAFTMYWFGVGAATAWLTFLILFMFAGLAEMSDRLASIERKLDAIPKEK